MRIALVLATLLLLLSSPARAQYDYGSIWWDAECTDGGPTTIAVEIGIGQDFGRRVCEVRVGRRTLGQCGSTKTVVSEVVDPLEPGFYTYEFVDPEPVGGLPFGYYVTLHDETGKDLNVTMYFDVGTTWDVVACGTPLITQGYVRSRTYPGGVGAARSDQTSPIVETCEGRCYSSFYVANAEDDEIMLALLDTDVPALLFGEVSCTGIWGCYIMITDAIPMECSGTTPATTLSWGSLKARY